MFSTSYKMFSSLHELFSDLHEIFSNLHEVFSMLHEAFSNLHGSFSILHEEFSIWRKARAIWIMSPVTRKTLDSIWQNIQAMRSKNNAIRRISVTGWIIFDLIEKIVHVRTFFAEIEGEGP